jgi:DNA-binding transcriptional ArsR family regulator
VRERDFPEQLVGRVSRRLALLADPVRVRLLLSLERRRCTVQELADLLDRSHQATSHHLNALYREGVLDRERDGPRMMYSVADYTACRLLALAGESVVAQLEELGELVRES